LIKIDIWISTSIFSLVYVGDVVIVLLWTNKRCSKLLLSRKYRNHPLPRLQSKSF